MKLELSLEGRIGFAGRSLALGEVRCLLDGIATDRSVKGAAQRLGVSYRSAWGKIAALEHAIGRPIVVKTKGHGTVLTELGSKLRETMSTLLAPHDLKLAADARVLEQRLRVLLEESAELAALRMAASHDPLLSAEVTNVAGIELTVVGSEDAVARLLSGEAEIACFHFGSVGEPPPPFQELFAHPQFLVRALCVREQGLMLAKGNPLGISTIADIADRRARFVNRQRGAGTRLWFDRLLVDAGIGPEQVVGYRVEEFTHQAVAAMIAAGAADVGMGLRAVASLFGLDFIEIGEEIYWLAVTAAVADDARLAALLLAVDAAARQSIGYRPRKGDEAGG